MKGDRYGRPRHVLMQADAEHPIKLYIRLGRSAYSLSLAYQ